MRFEESFCGFHFRAFTLLAQWQAEDAARRLWQSQFAAQVLDMKIMKGAQQQGSVCTPAYARRMYKKSFSHLTSAEAGSAGVIGFLTNKDTQSGSAFEVKICHCCMKFLLYIY